MLFPKEGEVLSYISNIKHKINTTDNIPIYSRRFRYPYIYKKEVDDQIEDLLKRISLERAISREVHLFGSCQRNWTLQTSASSEWSWITEN